MASVGNKQSKMRRLMILHGYCCHWCGKEVWRNVRVFAHNRATIDHVIPRSVGGSNGMENLVLACFSCNSARNVKFMAENRDNKCLT